jgi:hypothetical protein
MVTPKRNGVGDRDRTQVPIGCLELMATANDEAARERIWRLSDMLDDLGPQIDVVVSELESGRQEDSSRSGEAKHEQLADAEPIRS